MAILHRENKQAISCVTVIHHHSVHNYNSSLHVDVNDLLEAGDLAIQHFGRYMLIAECRKRQLSHTTNLTNLSNLEHLVSLDIVSL